LTIEALMSDLSVEESARNRYSAAYSDSQFRAAQYEKFHKFYAPPGGDQWPEDLTERPGKLHFTVNMVRAFVDTEARLLSIPPRIVIPPDNQDEATGRRAEATEKLFARYLNRSGFEQWSYSFSQVKSLYGMSVLKPYWNDETKMPDVEVIEQPQNIMFGWGDSSFETLDWAIYHYSISKQQARRRYERLTDADLKAPFEANMPKNTGGDHEDPLETLSISSRGGRQLTDYERGHVTVWDYWYVDENNIVTNAILVNGKIADGPFKHTEMPVIPYIPVENDHEPGSPDGHGTAELILDLQMGLNRALSHYAQHVWDTTDPAYQLIGEEAPMQVPPGLVPRAGELVAPGPRTQISEIRTGINNFPFDALIQKYWDMAHRLTGLSEILFGVPPGAQTSARALQAQLDSSINRLDPKRKRYYEGLRSLLQFWHYMVTQKNPEIDGIKAAEVIKGLNNWNVVAPEISPRDIVEHTTNVANKVNAKLISLQTAMDEVGVDNPLEEINRIMAERSNAHLFPGDAQAIAAVVATLQAIAAQQGAQGQAAEGQGAQAGAQQDAQQAQPTLGEGDNQGGVPTGPGSPPPGEASAPLGGEFRPIVRQSGAGPAQPMSELRLPRREF
jgi:hypothetical protein